MDELMEQILSGIISLAVEADELADEIQDLGQALDDETFGRLRQYLEQVCSQLTQFVDAINEDDWAERIRDELAGFGGVELGDDAFQDMVEDHERRLQAILEDQLLQHVVGYIDNALNDARSAFDSSNDEIATRFDLDNVMPRIENLKNDLCQLSNELDAVRDRLTFAETRDVLSQVGGALKDVAIVGFDIGSIQVGVGLLDAVRSGYSIYSGMRGLISRAGYFREKISAWFGGEQ